MSAAFFYAANELSKLGAHNMIKSRETFEHFHCGANEHAKMRNDGGAYSNPNVQEAWMKYQVGPQAPAPKVKQRAISECADALAILDGLRDATSNQVLWLGLLAARQRVETEQRFWEGV